MENIFWFIVGIVFYLKVMEDIKRWPRFWYVTANLAAYGLFGLAVGNFALSYASLAVAVLIDRFGRKGAQEKKAL